MRCPSLQKLISELHVTEDVAKLIRELARVAPSSTKLEDLIEAKCPRTWSYAQSCDNDPFRSQNWRTTMVLHAIDAALESFGVEPLGPCDMHEGSPYQYCNQGDPYATTLIYNRDTDSLRIGCWGDIAERHEDW